MCPGPLFRYHPRMITATVFNHAGGAGKTSITLNVGHELAAQGLRVLLIDCDPQGNMSSWMGVTEVDLDATVYPVATEGAPLPTPVHVHGLDLIPAQVDLAQAEIGITSMPGGQLFLRQALQAVSDQYDVCLIDSPPSLGQLAALGALASDMIVVPVLTSQKGLDALPGLERALEMYRRLRPELRVGLYVPTMYDGRRLHDKEVLSALQSSLPGLAEPIPFRGAVWMDSTTAGQPVGVYAPNSVQQQDVQRLTRRVLDLLGVGA